MLTRFFHWLRFKALMLEGSIRIWRFRRVMDRHLEGAYEELQRWGVKEEGDRSDDA